MKTLPSIIIVAGLLAGAAPSPSWGLTFTDGFEGAALDPFWTVTQNSGSITFPSNAQVHSGAQSLQVNSVVSAGPKNIGLSHQFATPVFGTVSLWVYDSGADLFSGNYLALFISGPGSNAAQVFANDFDLGPGNGGNYHYAVESGGNSVANAASSVDRTQDWHQFQITSTPTELSMFVDGQTVYSALEGFAFDHILFDLHGPAGRPAMTAFFDDFSFVEHEASSVPDASTSATLFLASLSSLALLRKRIAPGCRPGRE